MTNHKLKEPGSAITHLIGMVSAAIVSIPLIMKSFLSGDYIRIVSLIVFTLSMIGLYGASTAYHSFNISPRINKILKKLDHAMIFVLIAGSYTPICTIVLEERLDTVSSPSFGLSRFLAYSLKCFGSATRNGFHLLCILLWDGFASSLLLRSSAACLILPSCGSLPEALSIQSEASSML